MAANSWFCSQRSLSWNSISERANTKPARCTNVKSDIREKGEAGLRIGPEAGARGGESSSASTRLPTMPDVSIASSIFSCAHGQSKKRGYAPECSSGHCWTSPTPNSFHQRWLERCVFINDCLNKSGLNLKELFWAAASEVQVGSFFVDLSLKLYCFAWFFFHLVFVLLSDACSVVVLHWWKIAARDGVEHVGSITARKICHYLHDFLRRIERTKPKIHTNKASA